jgi:two-component system, response regulator
MADSATILLVEDNPDDAALTELALRSWPAHLEIACDGGEAVDYLFGNAHDAPRLVLLDLELPDTNGLEVLRRIREDERARLIPVVILTSSMAPGDVAASYRMGANSFVRKPVDFDEFSERVREIGSYWLRTNEPPAPARDG